MKKINTLNEIKNLNINQKLKKHLISYYKELFNSLADNEKLSEFSLKNHGPITLINDLKEFKKENLLQSWPEYIEKINTDENTFYRIFILRSNNYMDIYYFFPKKELPIKIKKCIEKYSAYEYELNSGDKNVPF